MTEHDRARTKAPRTTRFEREARITEIYKLLVMRVPRHDIMQFVAKKTAWGLKERAIDYLIANATTRFLKESKYRREVELGRAIATTSDILSRSYRIQDYKTCLAAQRELNAIMGLYAPKQVALTDLEGKPQQFIAIMPEPAPDMETWSRQCKLEREQLERQRAIASTTSGGQ